MAEIKTTIDYELDLTVHTVCGGLTTQKILQTLEDYYRGNPTKRILWDFSKSDWAKISSKDLRNAAAKASKHSRPGGKTAFVYTKESDFGIGRMLETFFEIETYDFEARSFMNRSDAEEWLGL